MVDILHRVAFEGVAPEQAYDALTTLDGLAGWWTENTTGSTDVGGVISFKFERGEFDMKVVELEPGERVLWEVVGGEKEWIGTKVHWDLRREDDFTVLLFKHEGWREPIEFMHHCSTKWASFLLSLKQLLETGKGAPWPHDPHVDNWG
ncbi:SRPBCC domain-containing protein [Glycomyces sp. TRM65418]|uniref:SRPBCC family protein n=1 Tax=Glycomyces sp. TRM65418 TaxID=2867006 RepID=UPI001CE68854|nr:SRPBCC domain-containing protein [Glycomyces sp. TRM65418]MCC3765096.1 SRPBCC domain-containing protein [Glycomyces sp. TRM65418]QZD54725.1 SRPBCC domain-containing protein [Glycomyces sp. TRM65418]